MALLVHTDDGVLYTVLTKAGFRRSQGFGPSKWFDLVVTVRYEQMGETGVGRHVTEEALIIRIEDDALNSVAAPIYALVEAELRKRFGHVESDERPPVEPSVDVSLDAQFEPEASVEPEALVEPEASVEPEAPLEPETMAEPELVDQPEPEASVEPEPIVGPEALVEPELQPTEEAEPAPTPLSLEEQAAAGIMLVEDEIAYRVGRLSIQVDEFAALLIESKFNAQAQDEAAAAVQHAINKQALGLALTEDERAAYDYATSMSAWAEAVEAHARAIKLDLPRLGLDVLRVYRVEEAQWPTMTSGDQAP